MNGKDAAPLAEQTGSRAFWAALGEQERAELMGLRASACESRPLEWTPWFCADLPLGLVSPERAVWLSHHLDGLSWDMHSLRWNAGGWTKEQRGASLQAALLQAREQGLLPGWRNEPFSFWHADCAAPDCQREALFQVERSGFRFLGLLSHAVHINGFVPDGRMWCARRSPHKATDPGMLDNLTAGGLPSGESVQDCLQRELAEEAGLFDLTGHDCCAAGHVRSARREPEGWHDEFLHVFNLTLSAGFLPVNQDGEVAEFMCLTPPEVLERIRAGEFTKDAVQTLIQGLMPVALGIDPQA
jgi:8-oxo-dGTP pyrophosphatase MutT (NUDIX family)